MDEFKYIPPTCAALCDFCIKYKGHYTCLNTTSKHYNHVITDAHEICDHAFSLEEDLTLEKFH